MGRLAEKLPISQETLVYALPLEAAAKQRLGFKSLIFKFPRIES